MKRITFGRRQQLGLGAAALLAVGVAGGAGAVALTRPSIEMAPTVATPIARLPASSGIVTVKGRVAEVYGDRFVVQDGSGKAMIDAGRDGAATVTAGKAVLVQGRYDDGQLRAHFLVGPSGEVEAVGPAHGPRGPGGPGGPRGHGPDGPPPPPGGPGGPGAPDGAAPPPPPPPAPGGVRPDRAPPPPAVAPAGAPAPVAPAPAATPAR